MSTAMIHDTDAVNHQRKKMFKCKSVLKKRKCIQTIEFHSWHKWMLCTALFALPYLCECQFEPRDPRWYSREGDFNYKWPNPGDPEYR